MAVTPLTAAVDAQRKDGKTVAYSMKASQQIWKGGLAVLDNTGALKPFADASNTELFVGVAYESNLSAASGTYLCRVEKSGVHLFGWYADANAAATNLQQEVYGCSDAQVTPNNSTTGTNHCAQNIKVGKVVEIVDATHVRVRIDGYS